MTKILASTRILVIFTSIVKRASINKARSSTITWSELNQISSMRFQPLGPINFNKVKKIFVLQGITFREQSGNRNFNVDDPHSIAESNDCKPLTESDNIFEEETYQDLALDSDDQNCQNPPDTARTLCSGELVMIIKKDIKKNTSLKAVVKLNESDTFSCKYGAIPHRNIIGEESGKEFLTSKHLQVLIRRPTLDEYVLRMPRLSVISFPKDICAMLVMIDASPGDIILEAGTGSGAVTLFLSKAVGCQGKIHSVEAKKRHQKLAMRNFNRWIESWNLSHDCKWTSNAHLHNNCLIENGCRMFGTIKFDGAVIDMEECHTALPVIAKLLKNGRAACFYVINITQVIEIYEMIRREELPFVVESVLEIGQRFWCVNPARRKSGNIIYSKLSSQTPAQDEDKENKKTDKIIQVPKYIAKPNKESTDHTGFLVKVVKLKSYPSL